jgi:hypothetical protein
VWQEALDRVRSDADARVLALQDRADTRVRDAQHEAELQVKKEHEKGYRDMADISDLRAGVSTVNERLTCLANAAHSAEVRRMDQLLAETRTELERLRGSNHTKGIVGEALVLDALRGSGPFSSWAFTDTSARGAQSDVHMNSPCGRWLVAIEVKNKSVITSGDVEKSMRDVTDLAERFGVRLAGYVFVSLRTRNIPRKGGTYLERVGGVPVLWFGCECEPLNGNRIALDELVRATQLLVDVSAVLRSDCTPMHPTHPPPTPPSCSECNACSEQEEHLRLAQEHAHTALLECLNTSLARMDGLRRVATQLQDTSAVLRKQAATISCELDAVYRGMEATLRAMVQVHSATVQEQDNDNDNVTAAAHVGMQITVPCGKVFASPQGAGGHKAHCTTCKDATS